MMLRGVVSINLDRCGFLQRFLLSFIILGATLLVFGYTPADARSTRAQSTEKPFDLDSSLYRGYPKRFDGWGEIHRINQGEIVIDDAYFRFAKRATFNTPRLKNASITLFGVGQVVGFRLNESGEIESLWRIMIRR